jgi:hypothetical protein
MALLDFPLWGTLMTFLVAFVRRSNPDTVRVPCSPKCLCNAGNGATESDPEAVENIDIHALSEGYLSVKSGCETFTDRVLSFLIAHET